MKKISFFIIIISLFFSLSCFCDEETQTLVITKEDIMNAKPTKEEVNFDKKDLHDIEMMEKRHFPRTYPEIDDMQRLKNLEFELLGRVWEYTPTKERIKKLKLASSNAILVGTALPPRFSSKRWQKRMKNDKIQLRERDNVGLIDGFLRLINPEAFEILRQSEDKMFRYEQ